MRQFELGGYKLQLNDTNFEARMEIASLFSSNLKNATLINITTALFSFSNALGYNLYLGLMPIIYREKLLSSEEVRIVNNIPEHSYIVIDSKEKLIKTFPTLDKHWGAFIFEIYNEYAKECAEGLGKFTIDNFTEFMATPTTATTTSEQS